MKTQNLPHPNPKMRRVYPSKDDVLLLQKLDELQLRSPYRKFPNSRLIFEWVISVIRRIGYYGMRHRYRQLEYMSWYARVYLIRWYYGPQQGDYMWIFPGYEFGFYDRTKEKSEK